MRIDSKVGVVVVADSREAKPTSSPTTVKAPEKSNLDSVVVLSAAGTSASQPTPATDPESIDPRNRTRLDEIRVAIKHDRYPIDLDKLASKMVDDEFVRSSNVS
jgi:anti-sigma28 factor (negative regulator of flagellin synthesis)